MICLKKAKNILEHPFLLCYNIFEVDMEKVRIAHMADFHIGGDIKAADELKKQVNRNLIRSLLEIFSMLNSAKVDLLLIAGDFYESSSTDRLLAEQIKEIFSTFKGKIIISPGNHDYISLESVYNTEWPDNTYIFKKEDVDYIEFSELNTRIYGFAFTRSHIKERKLLQLPRLNYSYINIGLFHGQLDSLENSYNPIFLEDIENSGLDYLALGHIHKRSEIKKAGNTYFAYSGNPVGRGFDETGEKGIYLGDISKDRMGLNFYKIDNSEFHTVHIQLEDFDSQAEVANQIVEFLENRFGYKYRKHYYKIYLEAFIKEDKSLNLEMIKVSLSDINYLEIYDNSKIFVDVDSLAKEDSLKGRFVDLTRQLDLPEEDRAEILDYGIRAFEDLL